MAVAQITVANSKLWYGTAAEITANASGTKGDVGWASDTNTEYTCTADGANWSITRLNNTAGAAHVAIGGAGGSTAVTTMENFLVAGGASQAGTSIDNPSGRATFQAVANGSSGAFTATVTIAGSNDDTNWETLGTITLSGTATTADSGGFATDAPWAYVRASVASFTGTGATCDVYRSV